MHRVLKGGAVLRTPVVCIAERRCLPQGTARDVQRRESIVSAVVVDGGAALDEQPRYGKVPVLTRELPANIRAGM